MFEMSTSELKSYLSKSNFRYGIPSADDIVADNQVEAVGVESTIERELVQSSRKELLGHEFFDSKGRFGLINDHDIYEDKKVWLITYDDNSHEIFYESGLRKMLNASEKDYSREWHAPNFKNICRYIATHPYFDFIILLFIFANCITMMVEAEMDKCDDGEEDCEESNEDTFYILNAVYTIVFALEMLIKMCGLGLYNKFTDSYFRDSWNYLDFVIVVEGIVSLFASSDLNISGVRALRVLRPLRAVTHVPEMKRLVVTILRSAPILGWTIFVCFFCFCVFGILGLQLFIGLYRTRCFARDSGSLLEDVEHTCGGGYQCGSENYCGAHILNPARGVLSFDNIFVVFLTLFQAITLEGWVDTMYKGIDAVGWAVTIYFLCVVFFGAFVLVNMTLAVILSQYDENTVEDTDMELMSVTSGKVIRLFFPQDNPSSAEESATKRPSRETKHATADQSSVLPTEEVRTEKHPDAVAAVWGLSVKAPWWSLERNTCIGKICKHPAFDIAMCVLILGNMIVLSLDHYPQSTEFEDRLNIANAIFTVLFVVEMLLKWAGLGLWFYFIDPLNQIDFVIIVAGVVELGMGGSSSFTALRAVRFVRLVKLVRFMESMQKIIAILAKSFSSAIYVCVLMLLFLLIYTILGMQFFKHKLDDGEGNVPRNNYDSLHWAFVSVFQCLAGENWPALLYDGINGTDWITGSFFYVSWIFVGQFLILNLMLAVIMSAFEDFGVEDDSDNETKVSPGKSDKMATTTTIVEQNDTKKKDSSVKRVERETSKKEKESDAVSSDVDKISALCLGGDHKRNLFCIPKGGTLHRFFVRVIAHPWFDKSIMIMIILSTLALAMDCPATMDPDHEDPTYGNDVDDRWYYTLYSLEIMFTTIFTFEAIFKTIAMGFVLHPNAYIRDWWNVLDFVIVIGCLLDLSIPGSGGGASIIRILRVFRVMRPLRVIRRNEGLRLIINTLIDCFGQVIDLLIILIFVWLMFSLLGVQLFKGRLYKCTDADYPPGISKDGICATNISSSTCLNDGNAVVYSVPPCDEDVTTYLQYNESYGNWALAQNIDSAGVQRKWQNSDMNFDNLYEAFLVIFVSTSGEGWPDVMFETCDITGVEKQPKTNEAPYYAYFWILFNVVVCFFFMELFLGAMFSRYAEMKRKNESAKGTSYVLGALLTESQKDWVDDQRELMHAKPTKVEKYYPFFVEYVEDSSNPSFTIYVIGVLNAARKASFALVKSAPFEWAITGIILLNTIILSMPFYEMGEHLSSFERASSTVFTYIFTAEVLVKWFALSLKAYFRDAWNCFDFVVVIISLIEEVVLRESSLSSVRLIRLLRVFKVIGRTSRFGRKLENLRTLVISLYLSIPALGNISGLLTMLYFVYAVLGVMLFGNLELEAPHSNFKNFPSAMLTLSRVSTGEDWQNLMYAAYDGDYGKYASAAYFLSFVYCGAFIALNLFAMVISDNFESLKIKEDKELALDEHPDSFVLKSHAFKTAFKLAWMKLDPRGLHFIPQEDLRKLLLELQPVNGGLEPNSSVEDFEKLREVTDELGLNSEGIRKKVVKDVIKRHKHAASVASRDVVRWGAPLASPKRRDDLRRGDSGTNRLDGVISDENRMLSGTMTLTTALQDPYADGETNLTREVSGEDGHSHANHNDTYYGYETAEGWSDGTQYFYVTSKDGVCDTWAEYYTDDGYPYFMNTRTGDSQWEDPRTVTQGSHGSHQTTAKRSEHDTCVRKASHVVNSGASSKKGDITRSATNTSYDVTLGRRKNAHQDYSTTSAMGPRIDSKQSLTATKIVKMKENVREIDEKWKRMIRVGVPLVAVVAKMRISKKSEEAITRLKDWAGKHDSSKTRSKQEVTNHEWMKKWLKMLSVGVPKNAVDAKMKIAGLDEAKRAAVLRHPVSSKRVANSSSSMTKSTTSIVSKKDWEDRMIAENPKFRTFVQMGRMGLPEGAIRQKMRMAKLDETEIERFFSRGRQKESFEGAEGKRRWEDKMIADDAALKPFVRMKRMGIPEGAVRQKMLMAKIDVTKIDYFFSYGRSRSQSSSVANANVSKMRKLHWDTIPEERMQRTMWATGSSDDKNDEILAKDDLETLNMLFSITSKPKKKKLGRRKSLPGKGRRRSVKGKRAEQDKTTLECLSSKRANHICICLAQFKEAIREYRRGFDASSNEYASSENVAIAIAVMRMDTNVLTSRQLETLITMLPSESEVQIIMKRLGKQSPSILAPAERFCHDAHKIPRFHAKVKVFGLSLQFERIFEETLRACECVQKSSRELLSSMRLAAVMSTVLAIGNAMNRGTSMEARAITLESLLKLSSTKATDNKTTVLEYLIKLLKQRKVQFMANKGTAPDSADADSKATASAMAIDFPVDLLHLTGSTRLIPSDIVARGKRIQSRVRMAEKESEMCRGAVERGETLADEQIAFAAKASTMISIAKKRSENLQNELERMRSLCIEVCEFFGEQPSLESCAKVFRITKTFVNGFEDTRKSMLEKERRQRQREVKERGLRELKKRQKGKSRRRRRSVV
eukprot:g1204.t1